MLKDEAELDLQHKPWVHDFITLCLEITFYFDYVVKTLRIVRGVDTVSYAVILANHNKP